MTSDPPLSGFFAALGPMLEGRATAEDVEARLGRSATGTAALGFYAELVRRNLHKILGDVYPLVRTLVNREPDGHARWTSLARDYACAHPGSGADPNRFAAQFSPWLRGCSDAPPIWAELADYEWTRVAAYHAQDVADDGFDARLFVRQYTWDVPAFAAALLADPSAAPPPTSPTTVALFRHTRTLQLGVFRLGAAGLAALACRRGVAMPPVLAALGEPAIVAATRRLEDSGVLPIQTLANGEPSCSRDSP